MHLTHDICHLFGSCELYQWKQLGQSADMGRRCVASYPTRPTRPLEHSHCRAKPTRTVSVHCEHILMWSGSTGRTRRSGRSVYTGNPTRTVRERYARRVKLPVCTRPYSTPSGRNQSHVGRVRFPLRAEMHGRAHITDSCFIAFITSKIC